MSLKEFWTFWAMWCAYVRRGEMAMAMYTAGHVTSAIVHHEVQVAQRKSGSQSDSGSGSERAHGS